MELTIEGQAWDKNLLVVSMAIAELSIVEVPVVDPSSNPLFTVNYKEVQLLLNDCWIW